MLDLNNKRLIMQFDGSLFKFSQYFSSVLGVDIGGLMELHYHRPELVPSRTITVDNDQSQEIYNHLYNVDPGYKVAPDLSPAVLGDDGFLATYRRFVDWLSINVFGENLVYQTRPTLRCSFPGNKAVGDWHRDRDYNHPAEEINLWVPLTNTNSANTIWVESLPDQNDYSPIIMKYGEFLVFDGILKHGNVVNDSDSTRLSFDFRVIPLSRYISSSKKSYARGLKFSVGEYYSQTSLAFSRT